MIWIEREIWYQFIILLFRECLLSKASINIKYFEFCPIYTLDNQSCLKLTLKSLMKNNYVLSKVQI